MTKNADPKTSWCTIAPINPYYRDKNGLFDQEIDMGYDIKICLLPDWVKDAQITEHLTLIQKQDLEDATHCFITHYDATALGSPDPLWKGDRVRGIQEVRLENIRFCNLALWSANPSSLNFDFYIHAQFSHPQWILREASRLPTVTPLQEQLQNCLDKTDIETARQIFSSIMDKISRKGTLWITIKTLINALGDDTWWEVRYFLLWLCLEAIFGSDSEISHQLSERIAFFLKESPQEKIQFYADAKKAYGWRSKIVHGRGVDSLSDTESMTIMRNTESFLRPTLLKILLSDDLVKVFSSEKLRSDYLRNLIFS